MKSVDLIFEEWGQNKISDFSFFSKIFGLLCFKLSDICYYVLTEDDSLSLMFMILEIFKQQNWYILLIISPKDVKKSHTELFLGRLIF